MFFEYFGVKVEVKKWDGELVGKRDVIFEFEGNVRVIFLVERIVLNVMGRMSGIVIEVRKFVEKVKSVNFKVRVVGMRKIFFKFIDKCVFFIGGGEIYCFFFSDVIFIKDNYFVLVFFEEVIKCVKEFFVYKVVEVEVESFEDVLKVVRVGVDVVMFDNMKFVEIVEVIEVFKCEGLREKVKIEVFGGIIFENIIEYVKFDVDVISFGYFMYLVKNFDVSFEIIGRF